MPVVLIFLVVSLGPLWFHVFFPDPLLRGIYVEFLLAVELTYGILLASLPVASIALTVAQLRARRRRVRRPWLIRGLALCTAMVVGLAIAEGAAWAWLAWTRVPLPSFDPGFPHSPRPGTPVVNRSGAGVRLPTQFPDSPGERTLDILVLGESSARGVPYQDWFSVGEIVAWKLQEAFPDRRFPVEHLARPGLTLDQVHSWMTSLQRRPDLVILYAGHNEFQMRYHWGESAVHYADELTPTPVTLEGFARDHSPFCRLIQQTIAKFRISLPPPQEVTRHLVDVPAYTAAEYAAHLDDFRTRLEAMAAYCERVGALVVLVIPPGNDADFEPNRSFVSPQTPRAEREEFARDFEAARRVEEGDPAQGIAAYGALLARQPRFAEAHYRLARLLEAAGRREEANEHYVSARDCDGFPMRCLSEFQNAYREVAARHHRAILVDGPEVLRSLSPRGVVGDNFFTDGLHPSLIGYTGLAQAILQELYARRAFDWPESSPTPVVTPADCAAHFGMNAERWAAVCDYAAWFYQNMAFIRFEPSDRLVKADRYHVASERIEGGSHPDAVGVRGIGAQLVALVSAEPPRGTKGR